MRKVTLYCIEEHKNKYINYTVQLKFILTAHCLATMRRFILLAFIGVFLVKNAAPSRKIHPSRLEWLFDLNSKQDKNKEEDTSTVCQSQECKKIAQMISESMDKTVDPCEDFYEYACGKWPEHNPPPEGMDSWSMFESAQMNVMKQVKEIFDEGPKDSDLLAVKLAKKWYAVCMDTDKMERQGLEPLVFTMSRIGGWPLIMDPDEWNEQEYSWQKVDDQYVRLTGKNAFHDVRVIEYGWNETSKVVHIDIPHLPLGSYRLWSSIDSGEEEDESEEDSSDEDPSDEDPSDEEKQSDEQKDSQEPGSEDKSDDQKDSQEPGSEDESDEQKDSQEPGSEDKSDDQSDNDDDDEDDDNSDDKDDDNDDDEDDDKHDNYDTNVQKNQKKRKGGMKKTGKLVKNKKLRHSGRRKGSTHAKKYESHKAKKERIKKRATPTIVHEKLRRLKNKRNHVKHKRTERLKKSKKSLEATTPRINTEEIIDEDDQLNKYANYVSAVARAIAKAGGIEVSEEHMDKDIQDMINFHIKLVGITVDFDDDEEMTLDDLQEWYDEKKHKTDNSEIDWLYKIGELFDEAHVPIDGALDLEIGSPSYFRNLVALLDKTSSRTIVNYIHWNFLSRIIKATTNEMRKLCSEWQVEKDEDKDILGVPARAYNCMEEVEMSDILAYEYVRNHFSDDITTTASDMMDDIQKEVEYQIKESDWMDENTKDFVLAKLVNMEKFIGYPDWYKNNTIVKRYFQGLVISNSYYENVLSHKRYIKWKKLRKLLDEDEDDDVTTMSPVMVNAFFDPDANSVAFSAADFQSPLFAYGRPQVINYGIVGSIMGHEVNHGFDDEGHKYDKNGDIVEWLAAMAEAYGKKAECFVEQFNNYPIDKATNYKIKNYGNQTAGENIADTMGLQAAYKAYRRRERECGKQDTVLPGHEDLTNNQLFFLSFANLWCEGGETSSIITSAKSDEHSTGRLRVIGSVSNSQDFAEAYNCPVGSAMNPEKKCHIWK
ncbi:PREDICTED: neprilysin-like [Vollenhovia emeryi]|uniref:neprilysin-like n=1 Tax=Vollenhovia emeryi TaxID=411798 RepID=UPI0005F51F9E|nr:PREDICTED: neprilysin-like [Vollenhovia emeryi]